MNREKNLMMYGFVSVLLLASFLMTVPANQYQKIFAQTEGEAPDVNVTEDIQENATDTEIPHLKTKMRHSRHHRKVKGKHRPSRLMPLKATICLTKR